MLETHSRVRGFLTSQQRSQIRAILRTQERSQAWLARQINMNDTSLAHYLSGRRPLPADLLPRIAHVLHVPESLLSDTTKEVAA